MTSRAVGQQHHKPGHVHQGPGGEPRGSSAKGRTENARAGGRDALPEGSAASRPASDTPGIAGRGVPAGRRGRRGSRPVAGGWEVNSRLCRDRDSGPGPPGTRDPAAPGTSPSASQGPGALSLSSSLTSRVLTGQLTGSLTRRTGNARSVGANTCGPATALPCPHARAARLPRAADRPAWRSWPGLAARLTRDSSRRRSGQEPDLCASQKARVSLRGPTGPESTGAASLTSPDQAQCGGARGWGWRPSVRHGPGAPSARGAVSPRGWPGPARGWGAPGLQQWDQGSALRPCGHFAGDTRDRRAPLHPGVQLRLRGGCPGGREQSPALCPRGARPLCLPRPQCVQASPRRSLRKRKPKRWKQSQRLGQAKAEGPSEAASPRAAWALHPGVSSPRTPKPNGHPVRAPT